SRANIPLCVEPAWQNDPKQNWARFEGFINGKSFRLGSEAHLGEFDYGQASHPSCDSCRRPCHCEHRGPGLPALHRPHRQAAGAELFPALHERTGNKGSQLSGGEQQVDETIQPIGLF
ncbi:MAG: hypothetical protein WBX30_03005, partial [Stellaceae bacterium]